jgi:predicted N-acetyltransferase YhbS
MIAIRTMTQSDLPLAMRLKSQAKWNQREADWRRFLAMQPDGCFVAECDGIAVATTVACAFGEVAWLAMVLVDAAVRGRGIGSAIVRHALRYLDEAGVRTVRLDATPLGEPVYKKLGFEPEYVLGRYEGVALPSDAGQLQETSPIKTARERDYERLCRFDRDAVGADRNKFLLWLFRESPESVRCVERGGEVEGYATVRPGSSALQIGPCIAASETAGESWRFDAVQRNAGATLVLDAPLQNAAAIKLAERADLRLRRTLLRMRRGHATAEVATRIWASSGPELG